MQTVLESRIPDTTKAFLRLGRRGRRRATQALRQSEQLIAAACDCTNVGVWTENQTTGELITSPAVKRLHGLREQAEINRAVVSAAVHPEDRPRVEACRRAISDDKPSVVEYRTLSPDGTVRWLLAQARVIADSGGGNRLVGVVQDITDR